MAVSEAWVGVLRCRKTMVFETVNFPLTATHKKAVIFNHHFVPWWVAEATSLGSEGRQTD